MKAFVTGGNGFIGRHLIPKLLERGYEVYALARSEESAAQLERLGTHVVWGNILETASMREGMQGSDVVFHLAAWYKLGSPNWMEAEALNVGGTRKVLRLAYELGVPKIVYTSTAVVFGDTQGTMVDESFYQQGPFLTEYSRTKWLAHYKVALPLIEKGAPIIIAMPGAVYGPGDTSFLADMMRLFYNGLPVLPGPEFTHTYAHVDDVAEGLLLAAEKGRVGESYLLTGPAVSLGELVDFWAYLLHRAAPAVRIPAAAVRPLAPIMGGLSSILPLPSVFSREATVSQGVAYRARSDKARQELGWRTRPLQTGMLETFDWIAATEAAHKAARSGKLEKNMAVIAIVAATLLLVGWLNGRRQS